MKGLCCLVILLILGQVAFAEKLTLDQCVELGKKNNPDFNVSKFSQKQAKNSYWNSYSSFIPYVSASLGMQKNVDGPSSIERINVETGTLMPNKKSEYNYNYASINGGLTLFNLEYYFNIRASKAYFESIKSTHQRNELDLVLNIKNSFYKALAYEKLLEAARKNVKNAQKQLEKIQEMNQLGLVSKIDVVKQQALLGENALDTITQVKNYQGALADLNEIIGRLPDEPLELDVQEIDFVVLEIVYNDVLEKGLENHPVLGVYDQQLKRSKNLYYAQMSQFLPSVSLRASHGWRDEELNKISDNFFSKDYSQNLSLNFQWTLFDGFNRELRLSSRKLDYKIAEENIKKIRNSLANDIKGAYLSLIEAIEKYKVNQMNFESAQQDLELVQEKYNLGSGSYLELLDSQTRYVQTQNRLIGSLYDYQISIAVLENTIAARLR